ncbi:MAG: IPT/TIG domain-containing protein, partial [Bryobacteraceae bacterium]
VVYAVGLGPVTPALPPGIAAPSSPPATTTIPMRIFFDGSEGEILFAGLTPGSAGLYQLNVRAPSFLARRYPVVVVQSAASSSNEVSAGGPSLLDVSPSTVRLGGDARVTLRGFNLPASSRVVVGGQSVPATLEEGPVQTLTAVLPGSALTRPGEVELTVVEANTAEAPSNPVRLMVQ